MKTLQNIFIVLIIGINFPLFGQSSGESFHTSGNRLQVFGAINS